MRTPNVYEATDAKTGNTVYFVGTYSDGRYTRRYSNTEYRKTGCSSEQGNLSYVGCRYTSKTSAQAAARRLYGYSLITVARYNLGQRYN